MRFRAQLFSLFTQRSKLRIGLIQTGKRPHAGDLPIETHSRRQKTPGTITGSGSRPQRNSTAPAQSSGDLLHTVILRPRLFHARQHLPLMLQRLVVLLSTPYGALNSPVTA
ncbi:Uncharacterised protein [Salmonella enterica subsp. enterica serovar Bovismorbificans]|nr:Uncharacterised protein [Salmonella enterica subsp. enterica serovar Bovismorbificans]